MQSSASSKESVQSRTAEHLATEDQTAYLSKVSFLDDQRDKQDTGFSRGPGHSGNNGILLPVGRPTVHSDESRPPKDKSENFAEPASPNNVVQFAQYSTEKDRVPKIGQPPPNTIPQKTWLPWPLRPYFWVPLVVFLALGAIGLEIALHFSKKNLGWPSSKSTKAFDVLHYVYTLPPVAIAAVIAAMWAWTDIEIKKMQPYIDLVHGNAPARRSLLLDYTRQNNAIVWVSAASNKHYLVALTALMVLVSLTIQPLASAVLVVKNTWIRLPDASMKNLQAVGLNQNLQFNDLTSFLNGAGYAGASVLYELPPPAFIKVPYTVASFELPKSITSNGTAFVNTTAIKSDTGCQTIPVQMVQTSPGDWTNSASTNGCSISWSVTNSTQVLFGADIPVCESETLPQFSPVVFWFFSYVPSAMASATFCDPSISLWEVSAGIDISTGNITSVTEIRRFTQSSNFSSFSANVTGPPLDGRAYNGVRFNLTNPDQFVLGRQNATQLQLPAGIYQAAINTPEGYQGSFSNNAFAALSDRVYGLYLTLVAREVYFLSDTNNEDLTVQIKTFQDRVWLSDVAVHLLAAALLVLACFGAMIHIFHMSDRRYLNLKHEPGTIASAVSIGAQTGVGAVLSDKQTEKQMEAALHNHVFRIDPITNKIVMEGEAGYETAEVPTSSMAKMRRKSILAVLQGQKRRRTDSELDVAQSPLSPKSPKSLKPSSKSPRSPKSLHSDQAV